mmetsp:Transcript_12528/g.20856  ORF Transcript_12528/g.20856 Transcript_12528/m.20856 type:complete len:121 (-) Transcript_12528:548-910(-)
MQSQNNNSTTMIEIDLTPLKLSSETKMQIEEPTVDNNISIGKKRKHGRHHQAARKYKRCFCCTKIMKKRLCLTAEWETSICRTCRRLKQAKLHLDMAVQSQRTTPKVLLPLPHVKFEEGW